MENGTVIEVSRNGGMIRVRGESATALVEMLGSEGELEVGDVVRGNWTSLGGETIYRGSEAFDVYIQDYS